MSGGRGLVGWGLLRRRRLSPDGAALEGGGVRRAHHAEGERGLLVLFAISLGVWSLIGAAVATFL